MLSPRYATARHRVRCAKRSTHSWTKLNKSTIEENLRVTATGTWLGRIRTEQGRYKVISIHKGDVFDVSSDVLTVGHLLQNKNPLETFVKAITKAKKLDISLENLLVNSIQNLNDPINSKTHVVSPHDLSSVKAAGVVFIKSLLERVVEEQAKGDASKALEIRAELNNAIGTQMTDVKPGSPQALQLLHILTKEKKMSHHYLEVGLGTDAEIFTKSQPMSSIGFGSQLGIHPRSTWNNPEPELVTVANRFGDIVGCCLGNDVNLRDFEGRYFFRFTEFRRQECASSWKSKGQQWILCARSICAILR